MNKKFYEHINLLYSVTEAMKIKLISNILISCDIWLLNSENMPKDVQMIIKLTKINNTWRSEYLKFISK